MDDTDNTTANSPPPTDTTMTKKTKNKATREIDRIATVSLKDRNKGKPGKNKKAKKPAAPSSAKVAQQPHICQFELLCRQAEAIGQDTAADIARAADFAGVFPKDVKSNDKALDKYGLDLSDLTTAHIEQANRIFREADELIRQRVKAYNDKINPPPTVQAVTVERTGGDLGGPSTGQRTKLFGYPVTAVIRWMGTEDWTFQQAKTALTNLEIALSDATIRAQLLAGKKGERGPAAPVTEKQANEIYEALD